MKKINFKFNILNNLFKYIVIYLIISHIYSIFILILKKKLYPIILNFIIFVVKKKSVLCKIKKLFIFIFIFIKKIMSSYDPLMKIHIEGL